MGISGLGNLRIVSYNLVRLFVYAFPAALVATVAMAVEPPPDDAPFAVEAPGAATQARRARPARTIGTSVWQEQGPRPMLFGQIRNVSPDNEVSGAVQAIAPHPTDPDILYVGSVNGGVWKSTNATAASPSYTALTDDQPSLAISELEFDPTDGTLQTVYAGTGSLSSFGGAGGVAVGLLRTTDGGATWENLPVFGNIITGIAARGSTIVVAERGGVFRSTDGGATFPQISNAGPSGLPFASYLDLESDPANDNVLYAVATNSSADGVYKSTDTGATWTKVSNAEMDTALVGFISVNNLKIAAGPNDDVTLGVTDLTQPIAIFHSDDAGATWQTMDLPTTPAGTPVAIVDASNTTPIIVTATAHGLNAFGDLVEIAGATGNTAANGIWHILGAGDDAFILQGSSGNGAYAGGGTWTQVKGTNPREKPGNQGAIHYSMQADPTDPDIFYMGGDRQDTPFPNYIGATEFSGAIYRADASVAAAGTSPSPQWSHMTDDTGIAGMLAGGTASSSGPHADSRDMEFDAAGNLLEGDDGGLYRRTSPRSNTGDWFSINGTLGVTEFHDVAYDTVSNIVMGGAQDNGTSWQVATGDTVWAQVSGADGGDVSVDAISTPGSSIRYSSFQNFGAFARRTVDAGNTLTLLEYPALTLVGGGNPLQGGFVTPVELNAVDGERMVILATDFYESTDRGDTIVNIDPDTLVAGTFAFSAAYGGRLAGVDNPDLLWIGISDNSLESHVYVRTSSGGPFTETSTPFPGEDPAQIALNPENWMEAYVWARGSFDIGTIYQTTDGGASWTDISGDIAGDQLNELEFVPGIPSMLVAATNAGVQATTIDENIGTWDTLGSGLPNVVPYDLDYDADDDVLAVGTLGRGAWLLSNVSLVPPVDHYVGYRVKAPRFDQDRNEIANQFLAKGFEIGVDDATITSGADDPRAVSVSKIRELLAPACKNDEGPADDEDRHYLRYSVKASRQGFSDPALRPARAATRTYELSNQFGTINVSIRTPTSLLLPAAKDLVSAPAAPDDFTHYVCYKARVARDDLDQTPGGKFSLLQAFFGDQFIDQDCGLLADDVTPSFSGTDVEGKCLVTMKKVTELCNPVTKTELVGGHTTTAVGIDGSVPVTTQSLLCYQALAAKIYRTADAAAFTGATVGAKLSPLQVRHARHSAKLGNPAYVTPGNAFGAPNVLDTLKPGSVCVPTDVVSVSGG